MGTSERCPAGPTLGGIMAAAADHRWISTLASLKLRFGDRNVVVRRRANKTVSLRFGFPRARQFSCCKKIRPTTADRCGLNHVTEVASEFIFTQMRSPTSLHETRVHAPE